MSRRRSATAAERRHLDAVASLGCVVCQMPCQIHHVRLEPGQPRDHSRVVGLCDRHHREFHSRPLDFTAAHGSQAELLTLVNERLAVAA